MKELIIIFLVFVISSCKKDGPALTGIEGKLINQKGEVQKLFKIYYFVREFMPSRGVLGATLEIKGPLEVVSDNAGNFIISEILNSKQSLAIEYPNALNYTLVDTFYVKSPEYFNPNEIIKGKYYKDVVIVVKK
jgi:hypothetical protein